MKKIMFNDRYGLTDAVLSGRKTMTRRIIPLCERDLKFLKVTDKGEWLFYSRACLDGAFPAYKIGEEVAVAQSYRTIYDAIEEKEGNCKANDWWCELYDHIDDVMVAPGYRNKMFVKAEYMPHRIRITNIKTERLQDISDEDCLREGVILAPFRDFPKMMYLPYDGCKDEEVKYYAKSAFAHLIDKVSRKGTWNLNPWVFVYEFELIK